MNKKNNTAPKTAGCDIRQIEIRNQRGLHARASAKFVSIAGQFKTDIFVSKDGVEVVGTSIMGLMMLAAAKGDVITLKGEGDMASKALDQLEALIANKFDEE